MFKISLHEFNSYRKFFDKVDDELLSRFKSRMSIFIEGSRFPNHLYISEQIEKMLDEDAIHSELCELPRGFQINKARYYFEFEFFDLIQDVNKASIVVCCDMDANHTVERLEFTVMRDGYCISHTHSDAEHNDELWELLKLFVFYLLTHEEWQWEKEAFKDTSVSLLKKEPLSIEHVITDNEYYKKDAELYVNQNSFKRTGFTPFARQYFKNYYMMKK